MSHFLFLLLHFKVSRDLMKEDVQRLDRSESQQRLLLTFASPSQKCALSGTRSVQKRHKSKTIRTPREKLNPDCLTPAR